MRPLRFTIDPPPEWLPKPDAFGPRERVEIALHSRIPRGVLDHVRIASQRYGVTLSTREVVDVLRLAGREVGRVVAAIEHLGDSGQEVSFAKLFAALNDPRAVNATEGRAGGIR
jgi:hypothetical protein